MTFACNPDKERVVDRNAPVFKTNDATRLFFKNVRLLYYDMEEQNDGKIQVLRLSSRVEDAEKPIINVDIINNWFQDRAYPMIRLSEYFNDLERVEIEMRSNEGHSETIVFNRGAGMDEHFYFASAIYEGILKKYTFKLKPDGTQLFAEKEERESFRITMVDYYRLVAIY
jgi:hypothetical protein